MAQQKHIAQNLDTAKNTSFNDEVKKGERFTFGENWQQFLATLDEKRIVEAELSLKTMLQVDSLSGKTFLDVGSGSGLFSLAARRLGAKVHSFDFDPASVSCASELRRQYFRDDTDWTIEQGSVLNEDFLKSMGQFDIVYSWGVLHHTGNMWKSLGLVADLVKPGGKLLIAIYNDQERKSSLWKLVKRTYCRSPQFVKPFIVYPIGIMLWGPRTILDIIKLQPFYTWKKYYRKRGMSPWRDVVDWVGGYPFEVAKPEAIFDFYHQRAFTLSQLKTVGGSLGNNQFVFERSSS